MAKARSEERTTRDLLNRRALILLFLSWMGEQLQELESLLPPEARTPAPLRSGATPTCARVGGSAVADGGRSAVPVPAAAADSAPAAEPPAAAAAESAAAAADSVPAADLPTAVCLQPIPPAADSAAELSPPDAAAEPMPLQPLPSAAAAAADSAAAAHSAISHPLSAESADAADDRCPQIPPPMLSARSVAAVLTADVSATRPLILSGS